MKKIILMVLASICLLYIIMALNTNSIIEEVKEIMAGKVEMSVTDGTPLRLYNYKDILADDAKVEVQITRLFTIHNFHDGYLWVKYSYQTIENKKGITPCAGDTLSRWKIHKENGKWTVVEIEEAP